MGTYKEHLWVLSQVSHLFKVACKHLETSNIFDLYSAALQPVGSSLAISVPRSISLAYGFNEVTKHHGRKI